MMTFQPVERDLPPFGTPKIWNVCFAGRERVNWFDRFLAPGFRHVFMVGYVAEFGLWLLYDVQLSHTTVAVVSEEHASGLIGAALDEGDVLMARPMLHVKHGAFHRFGFWCVPVVRHALGLRCVALTPRGLHRFLIRNGAVSLKAEPDGRSIRRWWERKAGPGGCRGDASSEAPGG